MKHKQTWKLVLAVGLTLLVSITFVTFLFRPRALETPSIDLSLVADGTYVGVCQNKILLAVVQVEVIDSEITGIEVLAHKDAYMEQAQAIAEEVVQKQSLDVDAISGATLTCDTVKQAIGNALAPSAGSM